MQIYFRNAEDFQNKKKAMAKRGADGLHFLADFDRTLTYGTIDGKKTPSLIALLRDGNHLAKGYAEKAHALFDQYHPIELDTKIPLMERKAAMKEWWEKHIELLIASGLAKADLEDIVDNGYLRFRDGVTGFSQLLNEKRIPLVVLSAGGGGNAIPMFFKRHGVGYPNVHFVINRFTWDDAGHATDHGPIIHSLNKDETVIHDFPEIYAEVKDRKNVILLGDSLGDLGMVEGFDYDQLITIGFLNNDFHKELRDEYKESFDVVLEGDGDFGFVTETLKEILMEG